MSFLARISELQWPAAGNLGLITFQTDDGDFHRREMDHDLGEGYPRLLALMKSESWVNILASAERAFYVYPASPPVNIAVFIYEARDG